MTFEEWRKDNVGIHPGVVTVEKAWNHQQQKIDELEEASRAMKEYMGEKAYKALFNKLK